MSERVDGLAMAMNGQYLHHGVTLQLDQDLRARTQGRGPGSRLTYGQAVAYQIIRDQDVAMTAYLTDSSGTQPDAAPAQAPLA